ncbi:hypothetical protein EQH57_0006 [Dictyocoela roeselum]|nr:hypothetical protein EQH57_0006 [Dictyocoela roeselum]
MKMCESKIIHYDQITEVELNSSNENKKVEFLNRFGKILNGGYYLLNNNSERNIPNLAALNYFPNLYSIQKQKYLKFRSLGKLFEIFILFEQDFNNHENRIRECVDRVLPSQNAKNVDFLWNSNFIDSGIAGDIFQSILSGLPTFKAIALKTINSNHENLNPKSDFQLKNNMFLNNQEKQKLSPEPGNDDQFLTAKLCFEKQKHTVSYENPCSVNDDQTSKTSDGNFDTNKKFLRTSHLKHNINITDLQSPLPENHSDSMLSSSSGYTNNLSTEKNVTKKQNREASNKVENLENSKYSKIYADNIFRKINLRLRKKIEEIFNFGTRFTFLTNKYIHQNLSRFDTCGSIEFIPFTTKRKDSVSLGRLIREIDGIKNEKTLEDADKKYETLFLKKNNFIYQEIEKSINFSFKNKTRNLKKHHYDKNKIICMLNNYKSFTKDDISDDEKLIVYSAWNTISSFLNEFSEDDIISYTFPEIKFINEAYNSNLDKQQVSLRNWIPGRYLKIFVEHKFELFKEEFKKDEEFLNDPEISKRILDIRIFYIFDLLKFLNTKKTILVTYALMSLKSYYLQTVKQFNSAIEKIQFEKVFKTPHVDLIVSILKQAGEDGTIDYKNFEI